MKRKLVEIITFHVFKGVKDCELGMPFNVALREIQSIKTVEVLYVDTDDVKRKKWTPADLVQWLVQCDYHIILSHIHQGKLNVTFLIYLTNLFAQTRFTRMEYLRVKDTT